MSKYKPLPSQKRLRELFNYDEHTGVFTWKQVNSNRVKPGSKAGWQTDAGYIEISVDSIRYRAHRLAWMYVYGDDPGELQVDHRNHKRTDNRLSNLRVATNQQNCFNQKESKGFYYREDCKKWQTQIRINGVQTYLGLFDCPLLARLAYEDACKEHRGEFA